MNPIKRKEILEDQKAPVIALMYVIMSTFGDECHDWTPEVLRSELERECSCHITDLQADKIQAGLILLTTNKYETDHRTFETISHLLNNKHAEFDQVYPLEVEEMISAMTDAFLLRMEHLEFSADVRVYAGKLFRDYGFHNPPNAFPEAIMDTSEGDDTEKNEALLEIVTARIERVNSYITEILEKED